MMEKVQTFVSRPCCICITGQKPFEMLKQAHYCKDQPNRCNETLDNDVRVGLRLAGNKS